MDWVLFDLIFPFETERLWVTMVLRSVGVYYRYSGIGFDIDGCLCQYVGCLVGSVTCK